MDARYSRNISRGNRLHKTHEPPTPPLEDDDVVRTHFVKAIELPPTKRRNYVRECDLSESHKSELEELVEAHFAENPLLPRTIGNRPSLQAPGHASPHVPGFKVVRRLGGGGSSIVYLAIDQRSLARQVAIKVFSTTDDKDDREWFRRETRTLFNLNHPNIVQVYQSGVTVTNEAYIMMEFVEGQSLLEFSRDYHLSIVDRISLIIPLCDALQYLHSKGIVHRDLKPQNVLAWSHHSGNSVKLIDFGIARSLSGMAGFVSDGFGTPRYAPPEQSVNCCMDHRGDIYSLGVLLRELLCNPNANGDPEFVPNDKAQALLSSLITKCVDPQPKYRYHDVGLVRKDLIRLRSAILRQFELCSDTSFESTGGLSDNEFSSRFRVDDRKLQDLVEFAFTRVHLPGSVRLFVDDLLFALEPHLGMAQPSIGLAQRIGAFYQRVLKLHPSRIDGISAVLNLLASWLPYCKGGENELELCSDLSQLLDRSSTVSWQVDLLAFAKNADEDRLQTLLDVVPTANFWSRIFLLNEICSTDAPVSDPSRTLFRHARELFESQPDNPSATLTYMRIVVHCLEQHPEQGDTWLLEALFKNTPWLGQVGVASRLYLAKGFAVAGCHAEALSLFEHLASIYDQNVQIELHRIIREIRARIPSTINIYRHLSDNLRTGVLTSSASKCVSLEDLPSAKSFHKYCREGEASKVRSAVLSALAYVDSGVSAG